MTINAIGSNKPIEVAFGGTGQATLTNHGVLVGAGTSAVTQLTAGTDGQVLVGSTGADPVMATLTSAGNSLTFTAGAGSLNIDGQVRYITRVLTNSEIKALRATPVTLLSAPGSGKMYVIHKVSAQLNYGGNNAFVNGGSAAVTLYWGVAGVGTTAGVFLTSAAVTGTTTAVTFQTVNTQVSAASTTLDNQPMIVSIGVATEISGNAANDNTISVYVYYSILTL